MTYLLIDLGSPPFEPAHPTGIYDHEEDYQNSKRNTGIQSRREGHGIFSPPGRGAAAQPIIKGKTDKSPDGKVQAGLELRK